MSDKEIIKKAVRKAIEGGWEDYYGKDFYTLEQVLDFYTSDYDAPSTPELLFNQEFAKALWGESSALPLRSIQTLVNAGITEEKFFEPRAWQYHLQKMVISDDPIKYLGNNI